MPQVKHVVLMRIKQETSPEAVEDIFNSLDSLREKIPGLLDFSGGTYSSSEGLSQGFTHGFVMTFADESSRDAYLPHPEHDMVKGKIVAELEGGIDGVVAFDWLAQS